MVGISEEEKKRLLHCVIIGSDPTGVEFSGELSDFIMKDVRERYSHVKDDVRVTLTEVNDIMSSFDIGLSQYATKHLTKCGVHLKKGVVKEVHPKKIVISDGTDVPIWPAENVIEEEKWFKDQNLKKISDWLYLVAAVEELTSALKDHDLFICIGLGNDIDRFGRSMLNAMFKGRSISSGNCTLCNSVVQEFELKNKRCNKGNGKKKVLGERKLKEDRLNLNCGHRQMIGSLSVMGPISPYGLLVWSTGVGSSDFVKSLNLPKSQGGRYVPGFVYHKMSLFWCALLSIKQFSIEHYMIGINEWMHVPYVEDVFAFGDCAGFLEKTGKQVLPALAQMEEEYTKVLITMERQMVAEKEVETQKKIALAEAEKNAQVSKILMEQKLMGKDSSKRQQEIENHMYMAREKSLSDADIYKVMNEAKANKLKLTPEYLELSPYYSDSIMCVGLAFSSSEQPRHVILITVGGTKNGTFQLMHGELQVLSPLVPIREVNFLRFCKQYAEGVWAVVDVSVDMNRDTSNPQTFVSSRRLPSGCVVQDMPNGYSKVTTRFTNLKELQISCSKVTDLGVSYLKGTLCFFHYNLSYLYMVNLSLYYYYFAIM
ncbi:hypothetical protein GIB67_031368, partial [Kingdonia uniflora]